MKRSKLLAAAGIAGEIRIGTATLCSAVVQLQHHQPCTSESQERLREIYMQLLEYENELEAYAEELAGE